MVVVGFILAIIVSTRRAKRRSLDPNIILDLGIYVIVFGIIGARIWFVWQFRDEFDLGVLNIFDGRLSIIGAVAGIALAALLYFCRGRIRFLRRLRGSTKSAKLAFLLIGIISAVLFSRVFYCIIEPEANVNIAYVNDPAKIDTVVTYEFPKYNASAEGLRRFSAEDALLYLTARGHSMVRFQSAFYYDFLEIWKGGLVYFGGVIGGVAGGVLFSHRRKFPFWKLADLVAPGVVLGLAAGRVGCLLNGCCWGKVPASLLPKDLTVPENELAQRIIGKTIPLLSKFSATFPRGSNAFNQHLKAGLISPDAARSLPVYLTQSLESIAAVVLFLIILAFSKHKRRDGEEILLLGMLYAVVRFLIEFLRADNEPEYLFGLTISQAAGIFVFLFCAFLFILRRFIAKPVDFSPPVFGKRQK